MLHLGIPLVALGLGIYAFTLKNRARRECYRVASRTCIGCRRSECKTGRSRKEA